MTIKYLTFFLFTLLASSLFAQADSILTNPNQSQLNYIDSTDSDILLDSATSKKQHLDSSIIKSVRVDSNSNHQIVQKNDSFDVESQSDTNLIIAKETETIVSDSATFQDGNPSSIIQLDSSNTSSVQQLTTPPELVDTTTKSVQIIDSSINNPTDSLVLDSLQKESSYNSISPESTTVSQRDSTNASDTLKTTLIHTTINNPSIDSSITLTGDTITSNPISDSSLTLVKDGRTNPQKDTLKTINLSTANTPEDSISVLDSTKTISVDTVNLTTNDSTNTINKDSTTILQKAPLAINPSMSDDLTEIQKDSIGILDSINSSSTDTITVTPISDSTLTKVEDSTFILQKDTLAINSSTSDSVANIQKDSNSILDSNKNVSIDTTIKSITVDTLVSTKAKEVSSPTIKNEDDDFPLNLDSLLGIRKEVISNQITFNLTVLDSTTLNPLSTQVKFVSIGRNGKNNAAQSKCNLEGKFTTKFTDKSHFTISVSLVGYKPYYKEFFLEKTKIQDRKFDLVVKIEKFKVGDRITLDAVYFKQNQYQLLQKSATQLNGLVQLMKQNSKLQIQLNGHTDYGGDPKKNLELSLNRVKSVRFHLIQEGIKLNRIKVKGFGGTRPATTKRDRLSRMQNRRVEFEILKI